MRYTITMLAVFLVSTSILANCVYADVLPMKFRLSRNLAYDRVPDSENILTNGAVEAINAWYWDGREKVFNVRPKNMGKESRVQIQDLGRHIFHLQRQNDMLRRKLGQ